MPPALQQFIDRLGGPRRALIGFVGLLAVALVLFVSRWATAPAMIPLVANVPIETMSQVRDKLTAAAISYQLTENGTGVLVAKDDYAKARIELAKGGMPNQGRPGLELFDQQQLAMTDFQQRVNYRRAIEGELERTIGKMRGIDQAQVHVAMQETSAFRSSERPVEASVVLKLKSGERPTADVVQGIAHLVAASVDGLQSEGVTIVDEGGRLLSTPGDGNGVESLTSRQMGMQREVESGLRTKAQEIVEQMVGRGNARVQVTASLNFDRVERTSVTMDPDKQVAATEQKAEIVPGAQGGAASTNTASSYENSKSTETFAGAPGSVKRLTIAVLVNNKLLAPGTAAKDSVPRYAARDTAEVRQIGALVRTAVGFDSVRGDQINVVTATFDRVPVLADAPTPPSFGNRLEELQRPILSGLALVFAFTIAVLAIRAVKSATAPRSALASAQLEASAQLASGAAETPLVQASPAPRFIPTSNLVRDRVAASVEEQPEVAAKLVRAWMKE